jgi:hypothetical protein
MVCHRLIGVQVLVLGLVVGDGVGDGVGARVVVLGVLVLRGLLAGGGLSSRSRLG